MQNLVIGLGEIGTAISQILRCDGFDPYKNIDAPKDKYDTLHICFPYSPSFVEDVKRYEARFNSKLTIIHSTVPVGTSKKLGAVHSPCRGIHPHLKEGILTFTKWFGGKRSLEAVDIFANKIINWKTTTNSNDTEAMKLWDTTIYGVNIWIEKLIYNYCKEKNLDFDVVYTKASEEYNEGYTKLGHPEYTKYVLKHIEGKIGGHCVINNLELLESPISEILKDYNKNLQ